MDYISIHSPVGDITLFENNASIIAINGGWAGGQEHASTPLLTETIRQLSAYFTGALTVFDIPLAPFGTSFQRGVYQQIRQIPYGNTRTYGEIALLSNTSPRPVGNVCGRNPIPIIIPCHRVLGAGSLGGYSGPGGVEMKLHLLRLEGIPPKDLSRR